MLTCPYFLHALSPLHAGTGQAMDLIDLPIARYKSTGIPFVPGSSIKGVLRDARGASLATDTLRAVFGPEDDPSAHAGALNVGDARLFALPVRSFRGIFAWVTSPLLLTLARRDLGVSALAVPTVAEDQALISENSAVRHEASGTVLLEDIDLAASDAQHKALSAWIKVIEPVLGEDSASLFSPRLVIVHDETMTFLCETATQVDQRVRIDPATRTVADGALWSEESLPPETLLLGVLGAEASRRKTVKLDPEDVMGHALPQKEESFLQFGGKATVGRGRCRIVRVGASL
jgi:CRISPR-associated protein Cmr4